MKSTIDYAKLRQDLINYYCAGMKSYPQAIYKLVEVERASENELRSIAINAGFNLENYRTYTLSR